MGAKVTAGAMPVPARETVCGLPAASSVMFTVAARAPGAAGVNVNVKVQLADAATDPPASGQGVVPEPATAKSPGLAPARVMLVRLSVAVPPLVRVTVWARPLVVPTRWLPKATLFADNVTAGAMPVPVRVIVCGLPGASSTMFSMALRIPVASGVKLTLIVQLAPGATEPAPLGQVLPAAKAKSAACAPVMVMLVRFSGAPPLLVSVTFCAALVVPMRCSPNALLVAECLADGSVTPVPVSDSDCGLPAASSGMVTVAGRALAAVGVKVRLRTQLAPAASVAPSGMTAVRWLASTKFVIMPFATPSHCTCEAGVKWAPLMLVRVTAVESARADVGRMEDRNGPAGIATLLS